MTAHQTSVTVAAQYPMTSFLLLLFSNKINFVEVTREIVSIYLMSQKKRRKKQGKDEKRNKERQSLDRHTLHNYSSTNFR